MYKHVRLTDREKDRLINDYGQQETEDAIKFFDEYIQEKGYVSKDHNLAMRRWVFNAVKERRLRNKPAETNQKSLAEKWGVKNDN
jgi:hypothetical protein